MLKDLTELINYLHSETLFGRKIKIERALMPENRIPLYA